MVAVVGPDFATTFTGRTDLSYSSQGMWTVCTMRFQAEPEFFKG